MAGHSKWANIKHRKARSDVRKGKLFSQILKEIYSAVRQEGNDPKSNGRLRLALQKARTANIPNETVQKSLNRAEGSQAEMYDVSYEIYGFGGVGIVCFGSTENKNRAASFVRGAVSSKGGSLAAPNSVLFNFSRKGHLVISKQCIDVDSFFLLVAEWGAEDVLEDEESILILIAPDKLGLFMDFLMEKKISISGVELIWIPKYEVQCSTENEVLNYKLIDALEVIEDIDHVFHNMNDSTSFSPAIS